MNSPVAYNESLFKDKLMRALVGGFVGTAIFTIMGKFLAPHVIGQPMDVAALMAPILGQGLFFGSLPKAMVALMGHIVFGLVMGAIIGRPANQ